MTAPSSWIGRSHAVAATKTFSEADVRMFGELIADFHPIHMDAEYAESHPLGGRVAQGALTLGLASTATSRFCDEHRLEALALGFDRVRYLRPVYLGDTVTCSLWVEKFEHPRIECAAEFVNQRGSVVALARPLLTLVDYDRFRSHNEHQASDRY